ncbi:hypothetical protein HDU83_007785, partial [Entophlyctis luteolus]
FGRAPDPPDTFYKLIPTAPTAAHFSLPAVFENDGSHENNPRRSISKMSNIPKSPTNHKQHRLEKLQEKGLAVSASSISQKTEDKRRQRADRVVSSGISESSDMYGKKVADCDTTANTAPLLRIRFEQTGRTYPDAETPDGE